MNTNFTVDKLSSSNRIVEIKIDPSAVKKFLDQSSVFNIRKLEYVPYSRYVLAHFLLESVGEELAITLIDLIKDRTHGGFLSDIGSVTSSREDYIKFATAMAHLVGSPNIDVLSGKYYATYSIKHTEEAVSVLWMPYSDLTMHTDSAYLNEPTDWVSLTKLEDTNVKGGEVKILHIDDWEDKDKFIASPLSKQEYRFMGPPSTDPRQQQWGNHRPVAPVHNKIFFEKENGLHIRYVDQYTHPNSIDTGVYLYEINQSFEASKNIEYIYNPKGCIFFLSNSLFVHGRSKLEHHPDLHREMMRMRGKF